MRSTATLEPDVSQRFQRLVSSTGKTRKALLNEIMRKGMDALQQPEHRPFALLPFDSGEPQHPNVLPSHALLDLEDEALREKLARSR